MQVQDTAEENDANFSTSGAATNSTQIQNTAEEDEADVCGRFGQEAFRQMPTGQTGAERYGPLG